MPVSRTTFRRALLAVGLVGALGAGVAAATSPASGAGYQEQQGSHGANTFTNYHNASGTGPKIAAGQWVEVSCKVHDPYIASANPDGYWYRIKSSPWNDAYYAVANTFMNGDRPGGPYEHNTDFSVPDCGSNPAPPPPPTPASVSLAQGGAKGGSFYYRVTLRNFPASTAVSVTCRDSADPGGFRMVDVGVDGAGNGSNSTGCFSGDGPDHWVTADSVESNHVTWSGTATTGGGGDTGGGPETPAAMPTATPTEPTFTYRGQDPCMEYYDDSGSSSSHSIFGGFESNHDRTASLYQVCEGFGGSGVGYSPGMKCALIAAGATAAFGAPVSVEVDHVCDAVGVVQAAADKDPASFIAGQACDKAGGIFATAAGIIFAGGSAATGPGAVAVGVTTYKWIAAGMKIACGGLFDGGAHDFGYNLETTHLQNIAADVLRDGKCIRMRSVFGLIKWSAASC